MTPQVCDNCLCNAFHCPGESPQCSTCVSQGATCIYTEPLLPPLAYGPNDVVSNAEQTSVNVSMSSSTSAQQTPESSANATTPHCTGPNPFSRTTEPTWSPEDVFTLMRELKKELNEGATFGVLYESEAWKSICTRFKDYSKDAEACRSKWLKLTEKCDIFDFILGQPGFTWNEKNSRIHAKSDKHWEDLQAEFPDVTKFGNVVKHPFPQFYNIFYILMYAADGGDMVEQALRSKDSPSEQKDEAPAGAEKRDQELTEDLGSAKRLKMSGNGGSGDAGPVESAFADSTLGEGDVEDVGSGDDGFENDIDLNDEVEEDKFEELIGLRV